MSEIGELYAHMKKERQQQGETRREDAASNYAEAARAAKDRGMRLIRHTDAHYQLRHWRKNWLLDLYPGNQRIYRPNREPRAPFLEFEEEWTLLDVVFAMDAAANRIIAK